VACNGHFINVVVESRHFTKVSSKKQLSCVTRKFGKHWRVVFIDNIVYISQ